ncbi:MAG: heavy-metal-associated domain-containing protein [Persicimonas sp.]
MSQIKLYVSGMSCNGCVNTVRTVLSNKLGLEKDDVDVSLDNGTAVIATDKPLDPDSEELAGALLDLKKRGFPAQMV